MSRVRHFALPDLGEGLTDADIAAWHVGAGDEVALNQVLLEVETEKAVVELPSPFAGTVVELLAAVGESVEVGAPLIAIDTADHEKNARTTRPTRPTSPRKRCPCSWGTAPRTRHPVADAATAAGIARGCREERLQPARPGPWRRHQCVSWHVSAAWTWPR